MFLNKESRQSAQVFLRVLKMPLYDGDCNPAARELLVLGDVDGAIAEWRRLADLGSGRARCVLAYISLKGTASTPPDIEEARRLASSALSGERGCANYVLACIGLKENQPSNVGKYLVDSFKAGFTPAGTMLGMLTLQGQNSSANATSNAVKTLRHAAAAGHRPALAILCRFYLRGRLGFLRRLLGVCLFPIATARLFVSLKYRRALTGFPAEWLDDWRNHGGAGVLAVFGVWFRNYRREAGGTDGRSGAVVSPSPRVVADRVWIHCRWIGICASESLEWGIFKSPRI